MQFLAFFPDSLPNLLLSKPLPTPFLHLYSVLLHLNFLLEFFIHIWCITTLRVLKKIHSVSRLTSKSLLRYLMDLNVNSAWKGFPV